MEYKETIKSYIKKPIEIQAIQFKRQNWELIKEFTKNSAKNLRVEKRIGGNAYCDIETLEGIMKVTEGDFIIKGVLGEFYSCRESIFKITYVDAYPDGFIKS